MENVGKAPWKFRTKLDLAAGLVEWCVRLFQNWFRRRVLVVADGAYAKRPFLQRVLATGAVVVSRLRKDAALFELPDVKKRRGKGRPRKYGKEISLARRGAHRQGWTTTRMILYGKQHEDSGFVCKCQNVQLRNTNNYLSCPNFKTSTSSGFGAVS